MRPTDEVIQLLLQLYRENFGGAENQRYLIAWSDLGKICGAKKKLHDFGFLRLCEAAAEENLYLWDLGDGSKGRTVAVIKSSTVDRWRRVPKKLMEDFHLANHDDGTLEIEDE